MIQNNIFAEEGFEALLATLVARGVSYSLHKVIPFIGELDPDPDLPTNHVMVMGSNSLARHAVARGWEPGALMDNLEFTVQLAHWGDRMLNADAQLFAFGELPAFVRPAFVRPVNDSKAFAGQLIDYPSYVAWRDGLARIGAPMDEHVLSLVTPVMLCPAKEIDRETRVWVVDGRVVTQSGYKDGARKRSTPPEEVDPQVVAFAQACADAWCPNRGFVLDIADTPDGPRIIEVNNLNSAGWYKADLGALVDALERAFSI